MEVPCNLNDEEAKHESKSYCLGTFRKAGMARCAHRRGRIVSGSTADTRPGMETPPCSRNGTTTPAPHHSSHSANCPVADSLRKHLGHCAASGGANTSQHSCLERRP